MLMGAVVCCLFVVDWEQLVNVGADRLVNGGADRLVNVGADRLVNVGADRLVNFGVEWQATGSSKRPKKSSNKRNMKPPYALEILLIVHRQIVPLPQHQGLAYPLLSLKTLNILLNDGRNERNAE
jgi:hypothetical protein